MKLEQDNQQASENPEYLTKQLITYLGNKRTFLGEIHQAISYVKHRCGKNKLHCLDLFSGSGIVSRLMKAHSSYLVSNDIEDYATVISRCFLINQSKIDQRLLTNYVDDFNNRVLTEDFPQGFIEEMYSPRDEHNITKEDRVFYTKRNARRIDNYRRLISTVPETYQDLLLGPLLSEASIHVNTAGVFKGFYKNRNTKVGQFGGSGSNALSRILGEITLSVPILSEFECEYKVYQEDANQSVRHISDIDLAYIDPPYNQHPYGSNYFMLNLITQYKRPQFVSQVSGIPTNWKRSGYNVRAKSLKLMIDLVQNTDAKFLLISFNSEGFIPIEEMSSMLEGYGMVKVIKKKYNTFRASRNLNNRPTHVTEYMYLVEK